MNDLDAYYPNQLAQAPAYGQVLPEAETNSATNLIKIILRHWRLELLTFLLICGMALPPIRLAIKPAYETTAAIWVTPIMTSILTGERDSGQIQNCQRFMNTQAQLIASSRILQRVADDLAEKNLDLFAKTTDIYAAMHSLVAAGIVKAEPDRGTELIKITMTSRNPTQAEIIVNAFLNAYMASEGSNAVKRQDRDLARLQEQKQIIQRKNETQWKLIQQMADEYGTDALTERQNIMLQRVASLQAELTDVQTRKMSLQAKVQLLKQTREYIIPADTLMKMRYDFVNSDLTVEVLTTNIADLEQSLIAAGQVLAPTNPELKQKREILKALKQRLEQRRNEVAENFDKMMSQELENTSEQELANAKLQLQQIITQENSLREMMGKQNSQAIEIGRKQLAIENEQEKLAISKQLYDTVQRRIQELEVERKPPLYHLPLNVNNTPWLLSLLLLPAPCCWHLPKTGPAQACEPLTMSQDALESESSELPADPTH